VRVSKLAVQKLRNEASDNKINGRDDRINYVTALRMLQPNLEVDEPLSKEWIVINSNSGIPDM
jgi:hypothetical protein